MISFNKVYNQFSAWTFKFYPFLYYHQLHYNKHDFSFSLFFFFKRRKWIEERLKREEENLVGRNWWARFLMNSGQSEGHRCPQGLPLAGPARHQDPQSVWVPLKRVHRHVCAAVIEQGHAESPLATAPGHLGEIIKDTEPPPHWGGLGARPSCAYKFPSEADTPPVKPSHFWSTGSMGHRRVS